MKDKFPKDYGMPKKTSYGMPKKTRFPKGYGLPRKTSDLRYLLTAVLVVAFWFGLIYLIGIA